MQTDYIHTHTDTPSWITDVCVCVYVCVCDMSSPLTWGGSDSLQADSCWTCTYNINTHTHTHTLFCVIISLALFSYNAHTHSWRVIIIIRSLNGGLKKKCFWNTSDIKKSVCITDCIKYGWLSRSEANVEAPSSCILSNGQQGATPVVSRRSQTVCKLMRKWPYFCWHSVCGLWSAGFALDTLWLISSSGASQSDPIRIFSLVPSSKPRHGRKKQKQHGSGCKANQIKSQIKGLHLFVYSLFRLTVPRKIFSDIL